MSELLRNIPNQVFSHEIVQYGLKTERRELPGALLQLHWPLAESALTTTLTQMHPSRHVIVPEQIHSSTIASVDRTTAPLREGVDGLVTTDHTVMIAAYGADCPIVSASDGQVRGIVHSGWRGTLDSAPERLIESMVQAGATRTDLQVHVSPGIRDCCYTVDILDDPYDRTNRFKEQFGPQVVSHRNELTFLNLQGAIRLSLLSAGIEINQLVVDPRCTTCHDEQFPSYRRQGQTAPRLVTTLQAGSNV
ncbi:polyphenol oxidase family protein [Candidatus Berkelbacteria bacterium]|nr:polyphenol oxidase family protein [Candidatus Berkelbacteria bacterium]